jgi:hypothetical protein
MAIAIAVILLPLPPARSARGAAGSGNRGRIAGAGAAGAVGAVAAMPPAAAAAVTAVRGNIVPHFLQKDADGLLGCPQVAQRTVSGMAPASVGAAAGAGVATGADAGTGPALAASSREPHFLQNLAVGPLAVPHWGQSITWGPSALVVGRARRALRDVCGRC